MNRQHGSFFLNFLRPLSPLPPSPAGQHEQHPIRWSNFLQLGAEIQADIWAMNGECCGRFPEKITAIGGLPAICDSAA
jgi:hypothetical protein